MAKQSVHHSEQIHEYLMNGLDDLDENIRETRPNTATTTTTTKLQPHNMTYIWHEYSIILHDVISISSLLSSKCGQEADPVMTTSNFESDASDI